MSNLLQTLNYPAYEYSIASLNKICNICDPFLKTYNLKLFLYGRVYNNGRYCVLTNHRVWLSNWFKNSYSIKGTAIEKTMLYAPLKQPTFTLWKTDANDILVDIFYKLDVWHGSGIYNKEKDYFEFWSFGTSKDNENIENYYIKTFPLFKSFCFYF